MTGPGPGVPAGPAPRAAPRPRRAGPPAWPIAWAVILAAGCRASPPEVASCAEPLSGVWRGAGRAPSGEPWQFHIVDRGRQVAAYPMFDDRAPAPDLTGPAGVAYSPAVFELTRRGRTLVGTRTYRAELDGRVCTVALQAAIRACAGRSLTLAWAPTAHLDWATCGAVSRPTTVTLDLIRQ